MDKLIISGPSQLSGEVRVSRAKNSVLKLMAATLMAPQVVTIYEMPELQDVKTMIKLLKNLGAKIKSTATERGIDLEIDTRKVNEYKAHYDVVKTMRASILVLGPLLGRFGKSEVSLPGGCAIGARPIDMHLKGLEKLGAAITLEAGYVRAEAKQLKGAHVVLPFPSVGATENIMMAAVFANGETIIENAAREPEIADLAGFMMTLFPALTISGLGTSEIHIQGISRSSIDTSKLKTYTPIGDRIEAATYLMAAVITNSEVKVSGIDPKHIGAIIQSLEEMGQTFELGKDFVINKKRSAPLRPTQVDTAPFPGFPTDAQAQLMAVMLTAQGTSTITEHIFENRFMHVPELERMGAKVKLKGSTAVIEGGSKLKGAPVMCTDLRASAALILAALAAEGKTEVQRVYHLDRGYEKLEHKLSQIGCAIERIK